MKHLRLIALLVAGLIANATSASAQQISTEEKFQDIFITAGYATAFGAALGAALLGFQSKPENHLRYVAVGASLGFLGGSALGTYMVLTPSFVMHDKADSIDLLASAPRSGLSLSPIWHGGHGQLQGLAGVASWQF